MNKIEKIITTVFRILAICLIAEAIRQAWNEEKKEDKKENK